jgi:hypothetical protein
LWALNSGIARISRSGLQGPDRGLSKIKKIAGALSSFGEIAGLVWWNEKPLDVQEGPRSLKGRFS